MYNLVALFCAVVVVLCAWRMLNWLWFKPKKFEKLLRRQGLKGNSYTFLFGDFKKLSMMIKEAKSKPINLSSDILPRVMPWVLDSISNYGELQITKDLSFIPFYILEKLENFRSLLVV